MRMSAILVILLFICFLPVVAMAHPPVKIEISFDSSTKIVSAVITHPVQNPSNHHIAKVDVSLNGEEVLSQKISRQDNDNTQVVSYRIPDAKPGDKIGVEAYCSINGKLENFITVE